MTEHRPISEAELVAFECYVMTEFTLVRLVAEVRRLRDALEEIEANRDPGEPYPWQRAREALDGK